MMNWGRLPQRHGRRAEFAHDGYPALALFLLAVTHAGPSTAQDRHSAQRARMVAEIAVMARETGGATGRPSFSEAVMTAMGRVPRHRFVPSLQQAFAYENRALPIGEGQTISQPFLVALMTDLLDPKPGDTVLEVGTGSGYQAAVLAELVAKVYTIEIVEPLGRRARQLLEQLGYRNVEVRIGDGYNGWPEAAPFDSIVVTAASADIPTPLIDQLKRGGRMVIPGRILRLTVSSACRKAAGWHHHDEAHAASEVRALHERSCELGT